MDNPASISSEVAPPTEPDTVELPLTPSARAILQQQRFRVIKRSTIMSVASTLLFLGAAIYVGRGISLVALGMFLGIDLIILAMIWGSYYWYSRRHFRGDLEAGVIVRTTGPIQTKEVSGDESYTCYLVLGNRQIQVDSAIFKQVRRAGTTYGTVDFIPRSQVVLEVRAASGEVVFQRLGYDDARPRVAADRALKPLEA